MKVGKVSRKSIWFGLQLSNVFISHEHFCDRVQIIVFLFFSDGSFDGALLTRPIESYLGEKSDIDVLFGYTSAVNKFDPIF